MTVREYDITGLDLDATLARARKLADRAKAKGLTGGYDLTIDTRFIGGVDEDGDEYGEERNFLIVDGTAPAFTGWRFVALVTWHNGAPILTSHPDYDGAPVDRTALVQGACDHCQKDRRRNHQVVVENTTTGERKVVGSTCLEDFLGHKFTPSIFTDPFGHFHGDGAGEPCTTAQRMLLAASRAIRWYGFVPRHHDPHMGEATADIVASMMFGHPTSAITSVIPLADDEDHANVDAVLSWIEESDSTSDWMLNLKAAVSVNDDGFRWVPVRLVGLVASAMGVWMRDQQRQRFASIPVAEAYVGTVGDVLTLSDATVVSERQLVSEWGHSTVYTFIANGHRFEWLTSGATELTVGAVGSVKGRIKRHSEWTGKDGQSHKATVLTRCKFAAAS